MESLRYLQVFVFQVMEFRIQVFTMDGEPVFKFGDSGPEGWVIRSFAFFTWTNSL